MSPTTPPPDQPQPTFDLDALKLRLGSAFQDVWSAVVSPPRDPAADAAIVEQARLTAPVVWLLGKVQSGKSSIVEGLTGSTAAEVGSGFKACTTTARIFDFPADAPVIRFLDTRGLGEAGYDPTGDLAVAERQAHLLLVVMKAMDPAQDAILAAVKAVRARHPEWPVLVAHTCLHEGYPPNAAGKGQHPTEAPADLARSIAWQRRQFETLPGRGKIDFAAIDFTRAGDGFADPRHGLAGLIEALGRVAPAAIVAALDAEPTASATGAPGIRSGNARLARAKPHILGYATAAAAVDVLPVAGAIAVPGVQAKLLHSLGEIYGLDWDRRMIGEFAGALGAGALMRIATSFGARQLAKLIPAYGQTAGAAAAAAMSFATTYALGHAAAYYLERKRGGANDASGVLDAYQDALTRAFDMAKTRDASGKTSTKDKETAKDEGKAR